MYFNIPNFSFDYMKQTTGNFNIDTASIAEQLMCMLPFVCKRSRF